MLNVRSLILVAFFVAAGMAFATSDPPVPTPRIGANQAQGKASKPDQATKSQQRGTKDAPLFVEGTVTAQPTETETSREAREGKEKAANENLAVRINGATALFTGLMVLIAIGQAYLFLRQLRYMREALTDTKIAANAAMAGADAAKAALRPWLSCKVELGGPLVFNAEGDALFKFKFAIENVGKTPAMSVILTRVQ